MNHTQIMERIDTENVSMDGTLFLRVGLAFLFRIGSIMIQVSSIPVSNVNLILMQNIIELSTATIIFFLFGYTIAIGNLNGPNWSIGSIFITDSVTEIELAVYAWTAITTTTTIFTTMTAGRMHAVGYVVITMLLSGLLEPLAMREAWMPDSYSRNNTFLGVNVTYVDFGGIGHVHLLAGTAAFLATIFIGRRLIRLKDIDEASLPTGAEASLAIGYLLVTAGTIGLMLPHPMLNGTIDGTFGIKCGLAIIGGLLAALIAEFIAIRRKLNSWAIARYLQGGLAGIVAVSSGTLVYSPLICFGLGSVGGLFFYFVQHFMFRTPLEDYCNVVPIHFYCAYFSVILTLRVAELTIEALVQFAWDIIVSLCLIGFYIVCLLPVFLLLTMFGILRNRQCAIDHNRAMKVHHCQKSSGFLTRLFPQGSNPELLVPGSRVRREEYQNQRLTEEVTVDLKTDSNSSNRKRRVENDEEGSNKRKTSRSNFDEVIEELEDFQNVRENKRFDGTRDIEARYVMMNRTRPLTFKKSRKYRLQGGRMSKRLEAGDGGFNPAKTEDRVENLSAYFEDLPDERRAEVLRKERLTMSRSRIEGNLQDENKDGLNVSQRYKVIDSETGKDDKSVEFLYYDNMDLNYLDAGFDEDRGPSKVVVGKDGFVRKKESESRSRDVEKATERSPTSKSGWVYEAASDDIKDVENDADEFLDKWFDPN